MVRDRDSAYDAAYLRRVRAMGIRDRPRAPRSPWQNAYAERLIGSIRRDVLDHVVVLGERHLRHLLLSYMTCHNETRTHLSLDKDAPIPREIQGVGPDLRKASSRRTHHQYVRI
jgi:transposase InsO family protein